MGSTGWGSTSRHLELSCDKVRIVGIAQMKGIYLYLNLAGRTARISIPPSVTQQLTGRRCPRHARVKPCDLPVFRMMKKTETSFRHEPKCRHQMGLRNSLGLQKLFLATISIYHPLTSILCSLHSLHSHTS